MIVILTKDVKGTGKAGEVVKVSDGYARNMLIPKGMAKEATEGNIRNLEKQKAIAAEKHDCLLYTSTDTWPEASVRLMKKVISGR